MAFELDNRLKFNMAYDADTFDKITQPALRLGFANFAWWIMGNLKNRDFFWYADTIRGDSNECLLGFWPLGN